MAAAQIIEVEPGLWLWRMSHPDWEPEEVGDRLVTSTCVESRGERALLDPLAPAETDDPVWRRLDAEPPTMLVVLKPDHVRSVDVFAQRYAVPAYGPDMFHRDDIPATELEPVYPGTVLPGGMVALYDGRYRLETPLWIPEHDVIVFSDALTSLGGELQVWNTPWHEERVLPAMKAMLDLPFDTVIVSHGYPLHPRVEFERALLRPSFTGAV
ncbi:MAG: MBL fold metallo-hydrolase [Actinobacteria bacterium]|nr:MBL fold metallo-hydrolase [Actinomycetota bacterium]